MTPLRTALILLCVCVIAASGCTGLPMRGVDGANVELQLEPADQAESRPEASAAFSGSPSSGQPAFDPSTPSPQLNSQQPAASLGTNQAVAQAGFEAVAPMAEMSAFIQELEAASHIDPAMRRQIMMTAMDASPEGQSQMIRHYRALLALGRKATVASSVATQSPTSVPAAVPFPTEPTASSNPESVVAATHNEPFKAEESAPLPTVESTSGVERQLEALLREMKKDKIEAAVHTAGSGESDDRSGRERKKSDDRPASDATWEQLVDSAIEKLEERRERRLDSDLREEDEARLRMLYLIADRRDDAVRHIASLEPEMQEFWSKQFFGLATLLNSDLISDRSNRLIESKRNLDEALRRLGESAPLFVRNLAFITGVNSYGVYTPFDDSEFRPGEEVMLYAEVENYRCKETARGYHTALRSTFEIFDGDRRKVAEHEFSTNEEYCKNARRDFFTICQFFIPKKLDPGKYVLRLTVADLNGDKSGESSITFHIRDES